MDVIQGSFGNALSITFFVFAMMVLVDYVNVRTRGKLGNAVKGRGFRQYIVTSLLGVTPGCLGSFISVSFYVRGIISFGSLAGCMIATCGDEAFVMLAMFPEKALILFVVLFFVGVVSAVLIDKAVSIIRIKTCRECESPALHTDANCRCSHFREVLDQLKNLSLVRFLIILLLSIFLYAFVFGVIGPEGWDWERITFVAIILVTLYIVLSVPEHYLKVHIWEHIVKKHLWRVLLWSLGALLVVHFGLEFTNIEALVKDHMIWVLLLAVLIGLIPESGPHLIFVVMFADGLIPFSVLLASSIVQEGHGLLPLLSYSVRDAVLVKTFNFIIGFALGLALYLLGV